MKNAKDFLDHKLQYFLGSTGALKNSINDINSRKSLCVNYDLDVQMFRGNIKLEDVIENINQSLSKTIKEFVHFLYQICSHIKEIECAQEESNSSDTNDLHEVGLTREEMKKRLETMSRISRFFKDIDAYIKGDNLFISDIDEKIDSLSKKTRLSHKISIAGEDSFDDLEAYKDKDFRYIFNIQNKKGHTR